MKALLVLKDLQPNMLHNATYLENHKKNWVVAVDPAVSLSTYSTLSMEVSVVDHIDHAVPRAPRQWTTARPRKGTTWSRGRRGSGCPRGEEYEGSLVPLQREAAVAAE